MHWPTALSQRPSCVPGYGVSMTFAQIVGVTGIASASGEPLSQSFLGARCARELCFFSGVSGSPHGLAPYWSSHSALSSPLPGMEESVQSFSLPSSFSSGMDLSDVTLGQPPPPVSHPRRPWAGSVVSPHSLLAHCCCHFLFPTISLKSMAVEICFG